MNYFIKIWNSKRASKFGVAQADQIIYINKACPAEICWANYKRFGEKYQWVSSFHQTIYHIPLFSKKYTIDFYWFYFTAIY